jgi:hypothetical protein
MMKKTIDLNYFWYRQLSTRNVVSGGEKGTEKTLLED